MHCNSSLHWGWLANRFSRSLNSFYSEGSNMSSTERPTSTATSTAAYIDVHQVNYRTCEGGDSLTGTCLICSLIPNYNRPVRTIICWLQYSNQLGCLCSMITGPSRPGIANWLRQVRCSQSSWNYMDNFHTLPTAFSVQFQSCVLLCQIG